jgi:hypothetical protein
MVHQLVQQTLVQGLGASACCASVALLAPPLIVIQPVVLLTLTRVLLTPRCPHGVHQVLPSHYSGLELFGMSWNIRLLTPSYTPAYHLSPPGSFTGPNKFVGLAVVSDVLPLGMLPSLSSISGIQNNQFNIVAIVKTSHPEKRYLILCNSGLKCNHWPL